MQHWRETSSIYHRVLELRASGDEAARATVIRIERSAYRRPGAKLLIEAAGSRLGSVSGGCLEEDVRQVALEVMDSGAPRRLHYRTGADDSPLWGLGLGCDGEVDIFVQSIDQLEPVLESALERLAGDDPFLLVTQIDGDGAGTVTVRTPADVARRTLLPPTSRLATKALVSLVSENG